MITVNDALIIFTETRRLGPTVFASLVIATVTGQSKALNARKTTVSVSVTNMSPATSATSAKTVISRSQVEMVADRVTVTISVVKMVEFVTKVRELACANLV